MAKIYTKTGDKGKTKLVGGCEVTKTDPRIHAYGTVDELNSHLGLVRVLIQAISELSVLNTNLQKIQNELFNLGSLLACENQEWLSKMPQISPDHIRNLESQIDQMTQELPELKNFILPGGSQSAAQLHIARTVCRRAERLTVELYQSGPEYELCFQYLNRLSDYLFVAARFCNLKLQIEDQKWEK